MARIAKIARVGESSDRMQALSDFWDRLRTAVYGQSSRPKPGLKIMNVSMFDSAWEQAKAFTKSSPVGFGEKYDNWVRFGNEYAVALGVKPLDVPGVLAPLGIPSVPSLVGKTGLIFAAVVVVVIFARGR
jgi:hypothetical protein